MDAYTKTQIDQLDLAIRHELDDYDPLSTHHWVRDAVGFGAFRSASEKREVLRNWTEDASHEVRDYALAKLEALPSF